jgi:hypothetical protein
MFFSNLVGDKSGVTLRNGGKSLPFFLADADKVSSSTVKLVDDQLSVIPCDVAGLDLFKLNGNPTDCPTPIKGAESLTYNDLRDTEENPLVVVMTKGVKFYNDIPTYLHVLFVNDDFMVAMLVYGACEFAFADGSYVALQRCNEVDLDRKSINTTFSCGELQKMIYARTKGGWDKSYEMVCPLLVRASSKKGISVRCLQENAIVFNQAEIDRQEKEEVRKEEEARLAKEKSEAEAAEKRKRAQEEAQRRAKEELARRQEEIAQKKAAQAKRQTKSSKSSDNDPTKRNAGAEAFFNLINGIK